MASAVSVFKTSHSGRGGNGGMRIITNGRTITKTRDVYTDLGYGEGIVGAGIKQDLVLTTRRENTGV